jgi:hypothetical protein
MSKTYHTYQTKIELEDGQELVVTWDETHWSATHIDPPEEDVGEADYEIGGKSVTLTQVLEAYPGIEAQLDDASENAKEIEYRHYPD